MKNNERLISHVAAWLILIFILWHPVEARFRPADDSGLPSPPAKPAALPNTPNDEDASRNSARDNPTSVAALLAASSMPFAASPNIWFALLSDSSKSTAKPMLLAPKPANAAPAATLNLPICFVTLPSDCVALPNALRNGLLSPATTTLMMLVFLAITSLPYAVFS